MTNLDKDRRLINKDTLRFFCNTNMALIPRETKVTGLVLEFPGLGGGSCMGGTVQMQGVYENDFTRTCAEVGIAVAYLFPGPWSWMNKGAVRTIDLVVDALREAYGLADGSPLTVMGGSMGGLGALIYSIDSRHTVTACVSHCPCHNVPDSYYAADEVPRTLISAVSSYDMPFEEALKLISPEHRVEEMKDIPYLVTADELDELFDCRDIQRMVEKMRARGLSVEYLFLPNQIHGGMNADDREKVNDFIFRYSGIR